MYKNCLDVVATKNSQERIKGPGICTFIMQQKKPKHNRQAIWFIIWTHLFGYALNVWLYKTISFLGTNVGWD